MPVFDDSVSFGGLYALRSTHCVLLVQFLAEVCYGIFFVALRLFRGFVDTMLFVFLFVRQHVLRAIYDFVLFALAFEVLLLLLRVSHSAECNSVVGDGSKRRTFGTCGKQVFRQVKLAFLNPVERGAWPHPVTS